MVATCAAAAVVALVAWWGARSGERVVHVACVTVAAIAGLYGVYVLVLVLGWVVFVRAATRWMDSVRRDAMNRNGERVVELRVLFSGAEEPTYALELFTTIEDDLGVDGHCGEMERGNGVLRYFARGASAETLVEGLSRAASEFQLPAGSYVWVLDADRPGFGQVVGT